MEIAELVLKYIQALSWPIVVLVLIWCLRRHLAGAIARLSRVDTPIASLEFENAAMAARELGEEIESISSSPAEQLGTSTANESDIDSAPEDEAVTPQRTDGAARQPHLADVEAQFGSLAREVQFAEVAAHRSPKLAIQLAWEVTDKALSVLKGMQHSEFHLHRPNVMALIAMLHVMHDNVVAGDTDPSTSSALDYVQSCLSAVKALGAYTKSLSEGS